MELSGSLQWLYLKFKLAHLGKDCHLMKNIRVKRPRFIWVGDNVIIGKEAFFYAHPKNKNQKDPIIIIGNGSVVNEHTYISAQESIIIEDRVGISPGVVIQDHSHGYTDVSLPILDQPVDSIKPIKIGAGSWIGLNAAILPGANIGRNCVIGINSVVNSPIPDYCVAVGAPARVVKYYNFEKEQWIKGAPKPLEAQKV
ncbi:MAG: hypothetical protein J7L53_00295 [Deltaproteobacteria bacterium]|nr:hypothetical protein [Deltaproteobacteria bacterium]